MRAWMDGYCSFFFFANHESHWGLCKHKTYLSQYLPFGGVPPVRTRPEHHMVGDC